MFMEWSWNIIGSVCHFSKAITVVAFYQLHSQSFIYLLNFFFFFCYVMHFIKSTERCYPITEKTPLTRKRRTKIHKIRISAELFNKMIPRIPVIYWWQTFSFIGIFTPSDDLAKEVMAASEVSGEKLWRMPLEESYWESMKSGVADMVNTGGRPGGAITAALFLKQVHDPIIFILWIIVFFNLFFRDSWSELELRGLLLLYLYFFFSLFTILLCIFPDWVIRVGGDVPMLIDAFILSLFWARFSSIAVAMNFWNFELCFAVCWWEGSMDAYRPGWPSLEREETHCNRIWHCYFSGMGFEELFLDADVQV